jgi:hypothetical protein
MDASFTALAAFNECCSQQWCVDISVRDMHLTVCVDISVRDVHLAVCVDISVRDVHLTVCVDISVRDMHLAVCVDISVRDMQQHNYLLSLKIQKLDSCVEQAHS